MSRTTLMPNIVLERTPEALHIDSEIPLTVVSSAVVGDRLTETRHIINMSVASEYNNDEPAHDLQTMAQGLGITEPFVGLLTAARLSEAQVMIETVGATTVAAVVTVGIRLPIASGVTEAAVLNGPGTINIILIADACLPHSARVNAIITATEAKTLALVEAGVRAPHGGLATGTGTDAIVIASTERGETHEYAGPIAPVGALMGRAVRRAMLSALSSRRLNQFLAERRNW
jgi:adenosylcobinamide hydrolase